MWVVRRTSYPIIPVFVRVTLGVRSRIRFLAGTSGCKRWSPWNPVQAVRHETQREINWVGGSVLPTTLYLPSVFFVNLIAEGVAGRSEDPKVPIFRQFSYHTQSCGFHELGIFLEVHETALVDVWGHTVDAAPIEPDAVMEALRFWHERTIAVQRYDV
jgi:hypothetical protein